MDIETLSPDSRLSIIIPVSDRHDDLTRLIKSYDAVLEKLSHRRDYTVVVDGHFPEAIEQLRRLDLGDVDLQVIRLARNFGESTALAIGFDKTDGDFILTLPAYHQIDETTLPHLFSTLSDNDVVSGRRWPRHDSALNQFATTFFHKVIRWITGFTYRDIGCGVRLLRRRVVDEVRLYGDQHRFLPVLADHRGFRVRETSVKQSEQEKKVRVYGPGVYFRRVLDVITVFFLVRFTKRPLRFFGIIGGSLFLLGATVLMFIIGQRLFGGMALTGRPALVITTLMMVLGAQLIALGLVGELVIFSNASRDKEYTVAETLNLS